MKSKEFNELIKNIHNKSCFEKLYKEYYPIIVKFIVRHFNDVNLAKDIAHDIFTDFLKREIDYIENPNAYIFTAANNLALKYKKRSQKFVEITEIHSIFEAYDKTEINFAIQKLDIEERDIIELKWLFGYSLKEIAKMKGYSLFALQKRHQRILKKLNNFLK